MTVLLFFSSSFFPVVAPVLCVVLVATYPPFGVTTILALPAEAILPFKEKRKERRAIVGYRKDN